MSGFLDFIASVGKDTSLKNELGQAHSFGDMRDVAEKRGFSINETEFASFFRSQSDAIAANVAGVDGNGMLVFGRDWAYPGPDTDGEMVM